MSRLVDWCDFCNRGIYEGESRLGVAGIHLDCGIERLFFGAPKRLKITLMRDVCDEAATEAKMPLAEGTDLMTPDGRSYDFGYDARRVNWPRLWERVLASVINAVFYGTLLVVAKVLGLL